MKKLLSLWIIGLICSKSTLYGQKVNMSMDSIETLLCKKWEVNYAMMGEMKIGRKPGAKEINFEFKKEKTVLLTSNNPSANSKGTWSYDTNKKVIKVTVNGKSNGSIISLKEDEFIMLVDTKEATPDDPMELKVVYKIKTK